MRYFLKQTGDEITLKAIEDKNMVLVESKKDSYMQMNICDADPDTESDGFIEISESVFAEILLHAQEKNMEIARRVISFLKGAHNA